MSRDLPATTLSLGDQRVRHLVPKPLNVHVFAAVLSRTRDPQAIHDLARFAERGGGGPLDVFDHRDDRAEIAAQIFCRWPQTRIAAERGLEHLGERRDLGILEERADLRREAVMGEMHRDLRDLVRRVEEHRPVSISNATHANE